MGKDGIAYLFVGPDQGEPLTLIENLINKVIPAMRVEGFEVARPRAQAGPRPRAVQQHGGHSIGRTGGALSRRPARETWNTPKSAKKLAGVPRQMSLVSVFSLRKQDPVASLE